VPEIEWPFAFDIGHKTRTISTGETTLPLLGFSSAHSTPAVYLLYKNIKIYPTKYAS
jgi:hypothetical protein